MKNRPHYLFTAKIYIHFHNFSKYAFININLVYLIVGELLSTQLNPIRLAYIRREEQQDKNMVRSLQFFLIFHKIEI